MTGCVRPPMVNGRKGPSCRPPAGSDHRCRRPGRTPFREDDDGSGAQRRAARLPARGACNHRGTPSRRAAREGRARTGAPQGRLSPMAGSPRRTRVARLLMAGGARRAGLVARAVLPVRGGARARQRAADHSLRAEDGRSGDLHLRQRRAEGEVPAGDRGKPDVVVPGLLGAECRLRPREPAHPGAARGRSLRGQRGQDLDDHGPLGRHDVLPGAHG